MHGSLKKQLIQHYSIHRHINIPPLSIPSTQKLTSDTNKCFRPLPAFNNPKQSNHNKARRNNRSSFTVDQRSNQTLASTVIQEQKEQRKAFLVKYMF